MRRLSALLARLDDHPLGHLAILTVLPRAIGWRFDRAAAEELDAVFELALRHPEGGPPHSLAVTIAGGRCRITRGAPKRSVARVLVGAGDLIRLSGGAVSWPRLIADGRFELSGDPFLALRFAGLFRLPVRLDPVQGAQAIS